MGTITKLKRQKRNKERVNVYLDGEFAFGLAIEEAMALRVGQTLTEEEISQLTAADAVHRAYTRVLRLLSRRARSTVEIRRYLQKKDTPDHVIDRVISRLEEAGYLNDRAFARQWIESRCRQRPRGARALFAELRQKGVPADTIREVLAELDLDERQLALRAGQKRARALRTVDDYETFARKLKGYLARRGFYWEDVRAVIARLWEERDT